MRRSLSTIAAILLAAAALSAQEADARDLLRKAGLNVFPAPQSVPVFTVKKTDGKQVSLADYKGKYLLLNFWATWCPPCRAEMPSMERLNAAMAGKDFAMLAISVNEKESVVQAFLKKTPYAFDTAFDPAGTVSSQFVGRGIPTTYILDKEGRAIAGIVGGKEWDAPAVVDAFAKLAAR